VDNSDNSELRRMSRQHCRTRRATWPQLKGSRGFLSSAQQNAKQGCYLERRVIPIIAVAIMIAPSLAYGSPACMTQSEARAKFPKAIAGMTARARPSIRHDIQQTPSTSLNPSDDLLTRQEKQLYRDPR